MASEVLRSGQSELMDVDPRLLRNAVDLSLDFTPDSSLMDQVSEFEVLEYIANTTSNELISMIKGNFDDQIYALKVNEMFNYGVTRMCFAVNLVAKTGSALFQDSRDDASVSRALHLLWNNPHTPINIESISEDLAENDSNTPVKGWAASKQQAAHFNALHTLAFDIGIKGKKEFDDSQAYNLTLGGAIMALGVLGRILEITIEDEEQKEGITREWRSYISYL